MAAKKKTTKKKAAPKSSNKTALKNYLASKGLRLPHGYETTKRKRK
jgi:hypothetical protein